MAEVITQQPTILDPHKKAEDFRNYETSSAAAMVKETYRLMHTQQTFAEVTRLHKEFIHTDRGKRNTIWELIEKLDAVIDESDPDLDLGQTVHAFQTAEALRAKFPELDWLHLVGLIHDVGKILALPEYGNLPQHFVVGDTFPLGVRYSDKIVHCDSFAANPDATNPSYNSENGIYKPKCGLDNVLFSFGHDEYMYQLCIRNGCKIPAAGLAIIRYHSAYPWHSGGAYRHLMDDSDEEKLLWVNRFNECDLYSKSNIVLPDPAALKNYYENLVQKYFPQPVLRI
jgi:inositol oxygenase